MYNTPPPEVNVQLRQHRRKRCERQILDEGTFVGKYEIEACVGRGGFGDIYGAKRLGDDSQTYALKLEYITEGKKSSVQKESQYFQILQDSRDFPRYYDSGSTDKYHYLVMELLGPSLSNTRREMDKQRFSLATTLQIGIKMIRCIEQVHRHGLIHCDIKPGNFLLRPDCLHFLALVDFGLAQVYAEPPLYEHRPQKLKVGYNGTLKYSSLNAMDENLQSRRDDLMSWLYSLYDLKNGRLPWDGRSKERTTEMKQAFPFSRFFNTLPSEFKEIFEYISNLGYEEEPNYDLIVDMILRAMARKNISSLEKFDWENLSYNHVLSFSPIAELPKATWFRVEKPKPILSRPGHSNYSRMSRLRRLCCMCV